MIAFDAAIGFPAGFSAAKRRMQQPVFQVSERRGLAVSFGCAFVPLSRLGSWSTANELGEPPLVLRGCEAGDFSNSSSACSRMDGGIASGIEKARLSCTSFSDWGCSLRIKSYLSCIYF
jgi:hypothetical protein